MFSKSLLVFLIVYFLSDFSRGQRDAKFFRKDYTYKEAVQSFYKFHSRPRQWAEAQRVCALEGASLFYPENHHEAQVVISYWNDTQLFNSNSFVYVGLSNVFVRQLFETTDRKKISDLYTNWGPGQPDNDSHSSCVIMDKQGVFSDVTCYDARSFICKKSLESLEWNDSCNMANPDYNYNEEFRKCYKLHTSPLDWNEAYVVCRVEESYLAVPDNQAEANYFVNITESARNLPLQQKYQKGIFHLGFHDKFDNGWWEITGYRLNNNIEFFGDNVLDGGDEKQCGSMFYTGLLNNIDCSTKSFFICEHDIDS